MKKILLLIVLILLTSCGSNKEDVIEEKVEEEVVVEEVIDVDMSIYSDTVVYAQVVNILENSDSYMNKTIRMKGTYQRFRNDYLNKDYYVCTVQDATACCSQGLEFILSDQYKFPEDYPEDGEEIIVTGVLSTYKEEDNYYCYLKDAYIG